ncbi:hypothetical protein CB1_001024007 [Camelus ferus]|nr:hypothetical protein CB1_001024007 [Camelus ferus]
MTDNARTTQRCRVICGSQDTAKNLSCSFIIAQAFTSGLPFILRLMLNVEDLLKNWKGYDDGYGGEYDDQTYEAYDNNYANQVQSVPEYYDYGHGVSEDAYASYAPEEWAAPRSSLKALPPRPARGGRREHPYGRY